MQTKENEFRIQFCEALRVFVTALSVGYSVENAIREVPKEMRLLFGERAVIIREFSYMIRQLEMNVTAEQTLRELACRVKIEEVSNFVTVFTVLKRGGGDMIQVLKNTIEKICMRMDVKQEIETMIAAKKMEFRIMTMIPIGIIVYMKLSFPEFMEVLYDNAGGMSIMSLCLGIYTAAWYMGKRMLEIEV